jgi:hypothetical protein
MIFDPVNPLILQILIQTVELKWTKPKAKKAAKSKVNKTKQLSGSHVSRLC